MDGVSVGCIGIALFLVLIVLRVPIAFSFGAVGFLGIWALKGAGVAASMVGSQPFAWASHYILMAIPLFILMGFFAFHAKISEDLYKCAYTCLGHVPGGLAIATIIGCAGFAATSGASLACSGAMGAVAIPEMEKHGYDKRLSTGCVAAGGTLGILIPPSIAMIIYGTICEESIGKLFIAGIIPGILLTLAYIAAVLIWIGINPKLGPPGPKFSWKERIVSLKGLGLMAALFVMLIGGIFIGVFTPTEGAAVGAFGAFIFAAFRKRITKKVIADSIRESGKTTCMIFILYITAMMFMGFLALTRLPYLLAEWIVSLPYSPMGILSAILFIYVPLGMVMDAISMLVLTLPIFFPIILKLGFDPIWFGILIVVLTELALITPPVGMNVYILKGVTDLPIEGIFRGIIPFAIADVVVLIILAAFPKITLYLPNLMATVK
jgi:C4-dicarboxylate transporter, DctM subunit